MVETRSTDTRGAYPWFGFEQTHHVHEDVDEPQIADEVTLGILLGRYAFACRKYQNAAEWLDELSDATKSFTAGGRLIETRGFPSEPSPWRDAYAR